MITGIKSRRPYLSVEDLKISSIGEQFCPPGHFNGPTIRENYIFHFVISGKGFFETHGKTYHLTANQGFLIGDLTPIYYKADTDDPWHYFWIIFSGEQAEKFFSDLDLSPEKPIYTAHPENGIYKSFKACMLAFEHPSSYTQLSSFYSLLFELLQSVEGSAKQYSRESDEYVRRATQYILNNFHSSYLRISDIALSIGIDRSYLSRIFTEKLGKSPRQYLLDLRMEKAKTYLQSTSYTVQTIANSVGYPEIGAFSKMFSRYYGVPPTKVRKNPSRNT